MGVQSMPSAMLMIPNPAMSQHYAKRLMLFRTAMIMVALHLILAASIQFNVALPLPELLRTLGLYAAINLAFWLYSKASRSISSLALLISLAMDALLLWALLYYSGGAHNPFVSLFLLPILIVAVLLPKPYIWSMAALIFICYAALILFPYVPADLNMNALSMPDLDTSSPTSLLDNVSFSAHAMGMWLSFLLSVAVILLFVLNLAESLRQRDAQLQAAEQENIKQAHIIALGQLAAGAAHELGTPLATMAVLISDMQEDYANDPELCENLSIIRQQIARCKTSIAAISRQAGEAQASDGGRKNIMQVLENLIAQSKLSFPHIMFHLVANNSNAASTTPELIIDTSLAQAWLSMINNAAEAANTRVDIRLSWQHGWLQLLIHDDGPGLSHEAMHHIGSAYFTTKPTGKGLGVYLARSVVERLQGSLHINNHAQGGAIARISLPMQQLGYTR